MNGLYYNGDDTEYLEDRLTKTKSRYRVGMFRGGKKAGVTRRFVSSEGREQNQGGGMWEIEKE